MLERTAVAQVRRVAELAKAARDARDQMLVHVGESKLGEPKVARGLHDPAAAFGLDPLPPDHPTRLALRDAIAALPPDARDELRALEGGPFPSEEATWAEIALGSPKRPRDMGRAMPGPTEASGPGAPSSQSIIADAHDRERRQQAMRVWWRKKFAVVGVVAVLEACAFQSGTTYAPGETGTAMRVESAQILSSREVLISGLDNRQAAGWGTVVGATLAGAAAYGLTEADNPAGVAVTSSPQSSAALPSRSVAKPAAAPSTSCATRAVRRSRSSSRLAQARKSISRAPTSP